MNIDNRNNNIRYGQMRSDFYERQLSSVNPLRIWLHTNRYFIIDMLVKANYVKGKRLVDLGCGNCNWNISLLPVHGVDVNEGMLKFARDKGRLTSYEMNDFNKTAVANQEADIVVASEVLEHLKDPRAFLKEAKRILKNDGRFILSVPYDTTFSIFRPLFFLQCFFHGYILGDDYYKNCCGHLQHFSPQSLYELLHSEGFIVDDIFYMRWFLIFAVVSKVTEESPKLNCNDLTIIIPTLNKVKNIKTLLSSLLAKYLNVKLIVCSDGSDDNIKGIVSNYSDKNVVFLDRSKQKNYGLTARILEGIKLVKTSYLIVMGGDLQHPPDKVWEIYNILKLDYDLVIASRVKVKNWRIHRSIISFIATLLGKTALLFRNRANFSYDILSGFWGGKLDFISHLIKLHKHKFHKNDDQTLFVFLKVFPKDTRIGEVFYEFQATKEVESRIRISPIISYLKSLFI